MVYSAWREGEVSPQANFVAGLQQSERGFKSGEGGGRDVALLPKRKRARERVLAIARR